MAETDLAGGQEEADSAKFDVMPDAIRLTMTETGLFSSRGPNRLGFAHETYGEFLAARYLHSVNPPEAQLRSLLYLSNENPHRLIPQLHEVSAWLASMDPRLFERIAQSEPEVLLLSDVSARESPAGERLVDALLRRVDREELPHEQLWDARGRLHRLRHDRLADQLRVAIANSGHSLAARALAIEIADAAQQKTLAEQLADVALDPSAPRGLRETAARAVVDLEVPSACRRLGPLALGEAGDDPDDQLRGYGLLATWPYLTLPELLRCLPHPKRQSYYGAYKLFLYSGKVEERAELGGLPLALEWACGVPVSVGDIGPLGRIAAAWRHEPCSTSTTRRCGTPSPSSYSRAATTCMPRGYSHHRTKRRCSIPATTRIR